MNEEDFLAELRNHLERVEINQNIVREFAMEQTRRFDPGLEAVAELFDQFVYGDPDKAKMEMSQFNENIETATRYIIDGINILNGVEEKTQLDALEMVKWIYLRKKIKDFMTAQGMYPMSP